MSGFMIFVMGMLFGVWIRSELGRIVKDAARKARRNAARRSSPRGARTRRPVVIVQKPQQRP